MQFDFLGKDSMRYYNDVPVNELVFANLKSFCARKDPSEQVFDQLSVRLSGVSSALSLTYSYSFCRPPT